MNTVPLEVSLLNSAQEESQKNASSPKKSPRSIIIILGLLLVLLVVVIVLLKNKGQNNLHTIESSVNPINSKPQNNNVKQTEILLITNDFVDLNTIKSISKYRSCQGHVVVSCDQKETKRNMKHSFDVKDQFVHTNDKLALYAPFDAIVLLTRQSPCAFNDSNCESGGELWLYPQSEQSYFDSTKYWSFSIEHIKSLSNLKQGDKIKGGDLIGYADMMGKIHEFDVVIAKSTNNLSKGNFEEKDGNREFDKMSKEGNFKMKDIQVVDGWTCTFSDLDSVYNYMSATVFAEYQLYGIKSRNDMIYTKEYRDAHACTYQGSGPFFSNSDMVNDWVFLKK